MRRPGENGDSCREENAVSAGKPTPHGRERYAVFRAVTTRYMDNDPYRHVNNAVYYSFFDTTVSGWLWENGLVVPQQSDIVGLVVSSSCDYFAGVAFPDAPWHVANPWELARLRTLPADARVIVVGTGLTGIDTAITLLEDGPERTRMIADIDQMDALVQSALTHLRDGRSDEASTVLELQSLLQTIADGYADLGKPVELADGPRLAVRGRALELERAITNIVDNAVKYGGCATLSVSREGGLAMVAILDGGPGIPEAMRDVVLEPFVRGEAARTMNDADGFGLGLTIARSIIEAHNGAISFADGESGGFAVRISLPVA